MTSLTRQAVKAALLAAACALPITGHAQEPAAPSPGSVVLQGEEALAVALQVLLNQGQLDAALSLVESLPADRRDQPDLLMLQAQILRAKGDRLRAVDIYRRLLARFPGDQRIRLELAETLFELKDIRASAHYFRLALSGDLPEADRRLARAYLSQALSLRPWAVTGGVGIAPDTNVNGATQSRTIDIWGLPFQLSDEARQRSGVGVNANLQAEGSLPLGGRAKLAGSVWVAASEYRERQFSSEGVGLRIGPEFAGQAGRVSLSAIGERRWYGGEALYGSAGVSLDAEAPRGDGLTVYAASLSAQRVNFDILNARDAWLYGLDVQRTRYVSPRMFWRASVSARTNRARTEAESYDQGRLAVGAYHALPWRFGAYVEPSVGVTRYHGPAAFFGVVREDHEVGLSARLVKEDYSLWGFSPYVAGQATRVDSTIPLYAHERGRMEFGVTRTF